MEFDPSNPPTVNSESIMAATRGAAREAMAEQAGLLRRTEIAASQPDVLEGYTLDPELAKVVKRLPRYLQPVVTLMATLVLLMRRADYERRGGTKSGRQHGSYGKYFLPFAFAINESRPSF